MSDPKLICEKIKEVFPEVGECGIDVDVSYDNDKGAYIVDLERDNHRLQTHLEPEDADRCVRGEKCVHLGAQIGQLTENIEKT